MIRAMKSRSALFALLSLVATVTFSRVTYTQDVPADSEIVASASSNPHSFFEKGVASIERSTPDDQHVIRVGDDC